MAAADDWSTPWSRRRATDRSDLYGIDDVRDEVTDVIRQLLSSALQRAKPADLSLEIIASRRQSASIQMGSRGAAIFFDLAQSMVLKALLKLIRDDRPYDDFVKVLAGCAGLAVAEDSPALGSALLGVTVPLPGRHYRHDDSWIRHHYKVFRNRLSGLLLEWSGCLVDGYILAHEVAHYLWEGRDKVMSKLASAAAGAFDFALQQTCYEEQPDFAKIAQYSGVVIDSPAALERVRQDLVNRRRHYEANREHLVEEIACDSYGFLIATIILAPQWAQARDSDAVLNGYLRVAETYFVLFMLSDLHQAMIRRAKLSVAEGIKGEKPGDIADMHFRKMALIHNMAYLALGQRPERLRTYAEMMRLRHAFTESLGSLKQSIDALVMMPVTIAIKEQIVRNEETAVAKAGEDRLEDVAAWRDHDLDTVFGRDAIRETFTEAALAPRRG